MEARRIAAWLSPNAGVRGLGVCLVLWVPLLSAAIDLAFGGTHDFLRRWLISTVIADTVALLCFGGILLVRAIWERVAPRFGVEPQHHGPAYYFGVSALVMPCTLPVGLWVGARAAYALGRGYTPDLRDYRVGLGFGAIMVAIFFLQRARTDAREREMLAKQRIVDLENANLKAQLATLTAEMNPHMLFNALNTIASLVHDNPALAEETVLELAEVYRGILRASGKTTHSLRDELRVCEAYLRVERARFGDRLVVAVDIDPSIDADQLAVPVLLLQPLVENAVKHGIAPRAAGGRVTIHVAPTGDERLSVDVEDDGVGLGRSPESGNGRALANCRQRLQLAFGAGAAIQIAERSGGGTRARVTLPSAAVT